MRNRVWCLPGLQKEFKAVLGNLAEPRSQVKMRRLEIELGDAEHLPGVPQALGVIPCTRWGSDGIPRQLQYRPQLDLHLSSLTVLDSLRWGWGWASIESSHPPTPSPTLTPPTPALHPSSAARWL